jgi:hypothetical protein
MLSGRDCLSLCSEGEEAAAAEERGGGVGWGGGRWVRTARDGKFMVGEQVARGLGLFGGASSEVPLRR